MRSSNPIFSSLSKNGYVTDKVATKAGISTKTFILLAITVISGFLSIYIPVNVLEPLLIVSGIVAFIAVIVSMFKPKLSMLAGIVYSVSEGILYGIVTYYLNQFFPGVGATAMMGTAVVFVVMLVLYNTGLLRGSALLRKIVIGSLISMLVGTLVVSIMSLTNPVFLVELANNFGLALFISIFSVVLGAFMLTLDFNRADQVIAMGLGKEYEWAAALGFMITLIYIYINILRLLVVLQRNR